MNKRILTYAVGLGLMLVGGASLLARTSRQIGKQSKSGVDALVVQAVERQAEKDRERIRREQAALARANEHVEQLVLDDEALPDAERLDAAGPVDAEPIAGIPQVPAVPYAQEGALGKAAYQTAILNALADAANDANVQAGGVNGIDVIKNAAAAAVLPAAGTPARVLYDVIPPLVITDAGTIQGAVTLVALATPLVLDAGISKNLLAGIAADVTAAQAAGNAVNANHNGTADVHVDVRTAAAAFGVTWNGAAWVVSRPLGLATIANTGDVLHFHEGDYSRSAGFFMGLDAAGNYAKLSDDNKKYALSRVDLTPNDYGLVVPQITPIAPEKVTLNTAAKSVNPIYGKGLTHLLLGADDQPLVATADDQHHLHLVKNFISGDVVLTNKSGDAATDWPLKGADNNALGADAKIFDVAATTQPLKFFDNGYADAATDDRNLVFAAVANNPNLANGGTAATLGVAVATVEADRLNPLETHQVDVPAHAGGVANKAVAIALTDNALLAKNADAAWIEPVGGANQGDVNLWWDDRYRQLFGTVAGIKPADGAQKNIAFGLFHGMQHADAFVLKPMQALDDGRIKHASELDVAASIFGATAQAAKPAATNLGSRVDLYRPRTMHTTTGRDYLIVTGGAGTINFPSTRAWVNSLPLMPPAAAANPPGHGDAGKLAYADFSGVLAGYDEDKTPHIDRTNAASAVVDKNTPYIVGRFPSYLAPVAGGVLDANRVVAAKQAALVFNQGTILPDGSVVVGTAVNKASLQGEVSIKTTAAGVGSFELADGSGIAADVELVGGVAVDEHVKFGIGSTFGPQTKFTADTTLASGDLQVKGHPFTVMQNSVLAANSKLGTGTTLVGQATLGAGANTVFNATDIIGNGSVLKKGSVVNQNDTALHVGLGGVVTYDAAAANDIPMLPVTDIALKSEGGMTGLHAVADNPRYFAAHLLEQEAAQFAAQADFKANNGVGGFKKIANNTLGGNATAEEILKTVATSAALGGALNGLNVGQFNTGRKALANMANIAATAFAGDVTGHGFGVAAGFAEEARNAAKTSNDVFVAGITKAKELAGVDDYAMAIPVAHTGLAFIGNGKPAQEVLAAAGNAALVDLYGSADVKKLLAAAASQIRQRKTRTQVQGAIAATAALGGALGANTDEDVFATGAARALGGDDVQGGFDVFNVAVDAVFANANPAGTLPGVIDAVPDALFMQSVLQSAVAVPVGNAVEKKQLVGDAMAKVGKRAAATDMEKTFGATDAGVVADKTVDKFINGTVVEFADAFKGSIVGGYQAANAGTDAEKLSRIYDEGAVAAALGGATHATVLKAMVTKALDAAYYHDKPFFKILNASLLHFDPTGGGDGNAQLAARAAEYFANPGAAPADGTSKKYLELIAGKQDPLERSAGIQRHIWRDYAAKDSGFNVFNYVADQIYAGAAANPQDIVYKAMEKLSQLPENAVAPAGGEFMADNAAVNFVPPAALTLPAGLELGSASRLSGVTIDAADTWQFGAGVQLPVGTTLPLWTLFRIDNNVDYRPVGEGFAAADGLNKAAGAMDAANNGIAASRYLGGEWALGKSTNLTAVERAKFGVANNQLVLADVGDGIKIVGNRKVQSKKSDGIFGGLPNVPETDRYSLRLPVGVTLPAGTKIHNLSNAVYATDLSGVGLPNFGAALADNIAAGNFKQLADPVRTTADFILPDALALEFPAFPTKLAINDVLPAGTMIKNLTPGALDLSADIVDMAGNPLHKADGVSAALNFANQNDVYVLPVDAKVVNAALEIGAAGGAQKHIEVTQDPLFTPGIIRGEFIPHNRFGQPYKIEPAAELKLQAGRPQVFAPGTMLPLDFEIKGGKFEVPAAQPFYVADKFTGYGTDGATSVAGVGTTVAALAAESVLSSGTKFNEQVVKADGADFTVTGDWEFGQDLRLPAGTQITMLAGFQQDFSNNIKAVAANGARTAVAELAQGGGPLVVDTTVAQDDDANAGGYVIHGGVLRFGNAADNKLKIVIPNGAEVSGTFEYKGAAPIGLTAKLALQADKADKSAGVTLAAGSVLAPTSAVETGVKVLNAVANPAPVLAAAGVLQKIKTDTGNALQIKNAGGKVAVLDASNALPLVGGNNFTKVEVGIAPLTLGADLIVAGAQTAEVASQSTLGVATQAVAAAGVTVMAPLTVTHAGGEALAVDSVIKSGSTIATNSEVGNAGADKLKVITAQLQFAAGGAAVLKETKLAGVSEISGGDATFTVPANHAGLHVPPGTNWNLIDGKALKINANTELHVEAGGIATLGEGSIAAKGATTVTAESPYAVSATDMQVIGDSVYIGLEGDRNPSNGIEAGVFKSTALFNEIGAIRGWTPWQRVGANTDATAFFGHDDQRGDLVYLTSPDGQAFMDASTNSLVNPATTVKLTQWSGGDNTVGGLHDGASLGALLAHEFAAETNPRPGVFGLFDFDADTRSFKTVNRRYADPNFSCMVATGYERVAFIQTGANDGQNFAPTKKFERDVNVFSYEAADGLAGIGVITSAEVTRNAINSALRTGENWFFVGGENGLCVLINPATGDGFKHDMVPAQDGLYKFNDGAFGNHKFVELKSNFGGVAAESIKNVRKIVADEATGYVYVVTKDKLLRIKPSAAAFLARAANLTYGALAGADIVTLANVADSKYVAGANGSLLTGKAISGGGDAELTDVAILKSLDNANHDTTLLLATSNGLVKSDAIQDAFAGDAGALQTGNLWEPFKYTFDNGGGAADTEINARDYAGGNADKKAAGVGAVLRMEPINLHSGGRMAVDAAHNHTFEGNLRVLATNHDGKALRTYRFDVTNGDVKAIKEQTNKVNAGGGAKRQPYFAKLGDMEPELLNDLDAALYQRILSESDFYPALPELPPHAAVEAAIEAAVAGDAELDLGYGLIENLYVPAAVLNSASGAAYLPAESGVKVNE